MRQDDLLCNYNPRFMRPSVSLPDRIKYLTKIQIKIKKAPVFPGCPVLNHVGRPNSFCGLPNFPPPFYYAVLCLLLPRPTPAPHPLSIYAGKRGRCGLICGTCGVEPPAAGNSFTCYPAECPIHHSTFLSS